MSAISRKPFCATVASFRGRAKYGRSSRKLRPSEPMRAGPRCAPNVGTHKESTMPRGDKSSYTDKQKRMAEHIEEGYEQRGISTGEAERRAWATVNKENGSGR